MKICKVPCRRKLRMFLIALCAYAALRWLIQYFRTADEKIYDEPDKVVDQLLDLRDKSPIYALLIDLECIRAVEQNQSCTEPVAVAVSRIARPSWRRNRWIKIDYWISVGDLGDYWALDAIHESHEPTRRLLPIVEYPIKRKVKIEHGNEMELWVPSNIERFERHWNHSTFVDCLGIDMHRPIADITIKIEDVEVISIFRNAMDIALNITTFVEAGTRLDWYRECDIIHHSHGIDFAVRFVDLPIDYVSKMERIFNLRHRFGYFKDNRLLQFALKTKKINVFAIYKYNDTMDYFPGVDTWKQQVPTWLTPKIDPHLCTGDLLGYLIYVPCNVESSLKMYYGTNWQRDYGSQGIIIRENLITAVEWDVFVKSY